MKQGWEYKKLGEVASFINGDRSSNYPSGADFVESGIPFINAGHLSEGNIDFTKMNYITRSKYESLRSGKIIENDILFCLRGSLGKCALVPKGIEGAIASSLVIIRCKSSNPYYLRYFLTSSVVVRSIQRSNNGSSQPNLSAKSVISFSVPSPPLPIQQSIVAELDEINNLLSLKRKELETYDKLAQSLFYEMFGDPVENEKGWEVKKLGEVCDITSSKRIFAEEYVEYGIPFYRSKEVIEKSKGEPISVELYISEERYNEVKESYGVPDVGDILITAVGTIGKIWVVDTDDPFYFKDGNLVWLKNMQQVDSMFFKMSLFHLIDEYKKVNAKGAAYNALTIAKLKEMNCPLPPLPLQHLFVTRIEAIEAQKTNVKAAIEKLETLLAARMQYWFE